MLRRSRAAFAALVLMCSSAASARDDLYQVGVVVPAFQTDDNLGLHLGFAIKTRLQRQLVKKLSDNGATFGSAVSYFVPRPMAEPSDASAVALARLNGLQGTLWGNAYRLPNGVLVEPRLTLTGEYEDYRPSHLEVWRIDTGDGALEVGPPSMSISFSPAVFSEEEIVRYGRLEGLPYCPVDGGGCTSFSDYTAIARLRGFDGDGRAIMTRGGKDYYVPFPNDNILQSEAIDYAAMVIAYYRGNLEHTIDLASRLAADSERASVTARVDAFLYGAAARARSGDLGGAGEAVMAAFALSPSALRVYRFRLMVGITRWLEGDEEASALRALWQDYRLYYPPADEFDRSVDTLAKARW